MSYLGKQSPILIPLVGYLLVGGFAYFAPDATLSFLLSHLALVVLLLFPFIAGVAWFVVDNQRKQAATDTKRVVEPKPRLRPYRQAWREWWDLSFHLDEKSRKVKNLILTVVAFVVAFVFPVGRVLPNTPSPTQPGALTQGWGLTNLGITGIIIPALTLLLWWATLARRAHQIQSKRNEALEAIYGQAAQYLKYPIKKRGLRKQELPFQSFLTSIEVKKWRTLEDPEEFFVRAPASLDATDIEPWETLQKNMDVRFPLKTGWHIEKDKRLTGATFMPSQYPTSVVWNGEYVNDDPLRFYLGADLDNPGELLTFTLGTTSPHLVTTGGTGAGKSSTAEAILCQLGTKPMPWSLPDDPIFGHADIIDPKGPLANRWAGRPNFTVVNGNRDYVDEDGNHISGIEKMKDAVVAFEEEMNARGKLIDSYGLDKWLSLPDEVLRRERLAPRIIVLDEYLDHTDKITGQSEQAKRDNEAREIIREKVLLIARKGRSYGYHIILVAQMANMTAIGSALMRQLVARAIMGNMDSSSYQSMFGEGAQVPILPTTQLDDKGRAVGIPGRGRIMNAPGMSISRFQAFWFGGKENDETLNKFLPRIEETPQTPTEEGEKLEDTQVKFEKQGSLPQNKKAEPAPKQSEPVDISQVITGKPQGTKQCSYCEEPATRACSAKDGKDLCVNHATSVGEETFCPEHSEKHPLVQAGLAELYSYIKFHIKDIDGAAYWDVGGTGAIRITINNQQGSTIASIEATDGSPIMMLESNNYTEGKTEIHKRLGQILK